MDKHKLYENTILFIQNFPRAYSEQDIRDFLLLFDPIEIIVSLENRWAFAHFSNTQSAKDVLYLVHQFELNDYILSVEYKRKNVSELIPNTSTSDQTENAQNYCIHCKNIKIQHQNDIKKSVKHLYANGDNLDLTQPVAPYLKYNYPHINRYIIDSITIALNSSPKFYTQVLHLMNRMNLEPPFVPNAENLIYETVLNANPLENNINNSTQTDDDLWQQFIKQKIKSLTSDESELESSSANESDREAVIKLNPNRISIKRKRLDDNKLERNKIAKLLKSQLNCAENRIPLKTTAKHKINDVFELIPSLENKSSNIKIAKPTAISLSQIINDDIKTTDGHSIPNETPVPSTSNNLSVTMEPDISVEINSISVLSDAELNENRIPADQLETHPLFRSYEAGMPSNKLYIKNIAKEVTEDDLKAVFNRYLVENCDGLGNIRTVDIRLMTSGRMKGQAFVTFLGPYIGHNNDAKNEQMHQMVERARRETNGLILKTKVIVVTFGKANK